MTYCENFTNRDLITNAMPLVSLTSGQWRSVMKLCETIERQDGPKSDAFKALEALIRNQSKIETMSLIVDNVGDLLDEPLSDNESEKFIVGA